MVAASGPGLQHDALFFDDEHTLASAIVNFVREGVERDETVLVSTTPLPVTQLLKALFADSPLVRFGVIGSYRTPAAVIDAYQRVFDGGLSQGAQGLRAVGLVDFHAGRLPWQEWVRYEAAINRVFAGYPLRTLCPFDTATTPAEAVAGLRQAHQGRLERGRRLAAEEYAAPEELFAQYAAEADPAQQDPPALVLTDVGDLRTLRMEIYPVTLGTDLSRRKIDDFVKALGEVALNAWTHGTEPVEIRLWARPDTLVGTVTDQGAGITDPLQGYARSFRPPDPSVPPRTEKLGLWAARQLCDVLDYARNGAGFSVRVLSFAE